MEMYVKISHFCIYSFSVFSIMILSFIYIDFTDIAASNTATDDVTNYVTHRNSNTNL